MRNQCIIKILDEVNAVIIGLNNEELSILKDHYALKAKGYFFSPKYKMGVWDGNINFFSAKGVTYVRLLPEIVRLIKTMGYSLKLIDNRSAYTLNVPQIDQNYFAKFVLRDKPITLAKHQYEAVNAITEDDHTGCVEAGTGAGKSLVNAALCDVYNKHGKLKTITIVPTTDLVLQTKETFGMVGLDVGEYSGTEKDLNHDHTICTWQSVINNPKIMSMFNMVVLDEAHRVAGKSLQLLLNQYGSHIIVRVGLTGTIPEDETNALTLKLTMGDIKYRVPASELIEIGWLANLKIKIIILKELLKKEWNIFQKKNPEAAAETTYEKFKTEIFPDYPSERNYLYTKKIRNETISSIIEDKSLSEKGNTLVIVPSVKQGKQIQEHIENSYFIDGTDKKKIRKEIYDLFKINNNVVVIATYKLVSTGLDIPRIFHLFLIDAGKNYETIIQSIGRGLRKADDKDFVNVYDICSDTKYSKRHLTHRRKFYKNANYNYIVKTVEYD